MPTPPAMGRLIGHGLSLLQAGRFTDVLQALRHAPSDPRILVQRAFAHAELGEIAAALQEANAAMVPPLADLWALDLLGNVFTRCHRPERAYAAFARAARVAPNRPEVLFNLATAARFMGHVEEAERAYDRTISLDAGHFEAYLNRSLLRRQHPARNHVPQLLTALGREPMAWQDEVYLRYALAKEQEDLGEEDAAFASIAHAASLRRRHMRYRLADDVAAMRRIAAVHDAQWCAPAQTDVARNGPIFIVGMPRSGSTLLERMLGRHSAIQSLGELPFFGQALVGAFRDRAGRMPTGKSELIDASATLDMVGLGRRYRAVADPLRDSKPRFIDKLPINFLYAGLIARAVAGATLLHIRRDPMDLCFAIFKTLFRDGYPFSYEQSELGAYHQAYRGLMEHWRATLGDRLVEVDYEALVTGPGETMAALLPKLGLSFEAGCLHPEQNAVPVMTASASQVRAPIHTQSVGSSARFARHLQPLRDALGAGAQP